MHRAAITTEESSLCVPYASTGPQPGAAVVASWRPGAAHVDRLRTREPPLVVDSCCMRRVNDDGVVPRTACRGPMIYWSGSEVE
jgi:hypothetical protein